eukprot:COSAG06_NODE_13640_length_1236_cov_1.534741_1_plen_406_part_10
MPWANTTNSTDVVDSTIVALNDISSTECRGTLKLTFNHPGTFEMRLSALTQTMGRLDYLVTIDVAPGGLSMNASTVSSPELLVPVFKSGDSSLGRPNLAFDGSTYGFSVRARDVNKNPRIGRDQLVVEILRKDVSLLGPSKDLQPEQPFNTTLMTEYMCNLTDCRQSKGVIVLPGSKDTGEYNFTRAISQYGVFTVSAWLCDTVHARSCLSDNPARHRFRIAGGEDSSIFTICPQNSALRNADQATSYGEVLQLCLCEPGFWAAKPGTTCLACPAGKFAAQQGGSLDTACSNCNPGTACDCHSGPDFAQVDADNCSNFAWSPACKSCTQCQVGRYEDRSGKSSCDRCEEGFYCDRSKMTLPVAKPGYWIDSTNSRNRYKCTSLEACPGSILFTSSGDDHPEFRPTA